MADLEPTDREQKHRHHHHHHATDAAEGQASAHRRHHHHHHRQREEGAVDDEHGEHHHHHHHRRHHHRHHGDAADGAPASDGTQLSGTQRHSAHASHASHVSRRPTPASFKESQASGSVVSTKTSSRPSAAAGSGSAAPPAATGRTSGGPAPASSRPAAVSSAPAAAVASPPKPKVAVPKPAAPKPAESAPAKVGFLPQQVAAADDAMQRLNISPVKRRAVLGSKSKRPLEVMQKIHSPRDLLVGVGGAATSLAKQLLPEEVVSPPKAGAYARRKIPQTLFRKMYIRGDIPVRVIHGAKRTLRWGVKVEELDYTRFLPVFFDGLVEHEEPYRFLAAQGTAEMLEVGNIEQILNALPLLIQPIRQGLNVRDPDMICSMLKVLQKLVSNVEVGEALVPYYRQILPILNMYKNKNVHTGDQILYSQRMNMVLGDLIDETLHQFEHFGGENAFINIKYMVPTYEGNAQWEPPPSGAGGIA